MVYGEIANKDRTAGVPAQRKSVKATDTKPEKGKDIPTLKKYIFQMNLLIYALSYPIILLEL